MISKRQWLYFLFVVLLIFMPAHFLIFSCVFKSVKILSLWRDVIIIYLLIATSKGKLKRKVLDVCIIISVFVILLYSIANLSSASINTARTYCVPILIYFFVRNFEFDEKKLKQIICVSWFVSVSITMWGLFQAYVLGPDILIRMGYAGNNGVFSSSAFYINTWNQQRMVGTFSSPNGCGAYLAIMIILFVSFWERVDRHKTIFLIGILINVLGLIATFSRSAWMGCAFGLIICNFHKLRRFKVKRQTMIYVGITLSLVIFAVALLGNTNIFGKILNMFTSHFSRTMSGEDASFKYHMKQLYEPIVLVINNPFGLGFGTNGSIALSHLNAESTHQVESSIWVMAYELGMIGMIIYYMPYVYGILRGFKEKKNMIIRTALGVLVCIFMIYLVLPSVQVYEQPFYAMVMLGIMQKQIELKRKD